MAARRAVNRRPRSPLATPLGQRSPITEASCRHLNKRSRERLQRFAVATADIHDLFSLICIKEAERKNKAAAALSPIELIALGLDAVETGTYEYSPSTYGTVLDPHRFSRRYNHAAKSPLMRRTARWSGANTA
jgi:hypothetical protein